ncbi:MAG: PAS domain-containing protein [Verrucomicrobia bacterium]|nr:PAS domain-containing protein [Verrucomicrobiota bacterium]|tara:strand:- start:508 stop:2649 length:2142 start_codon:yes stop_codon:yes gene_type:complete
MFALMGAILGMLLTVLAVGHDIPGMMRWVCLGLGLSMLMVSVSGSARLELFESQMRLRKTRRERDEIERYFSALMDTMPAWIFFKDRDSKFLQVNKALADYSGLKPEDIKGESDSAFLDEESTRKNREDEIEILASGVGRERFIEKESTPDGGIAWVITSKLPLRDKQGRIIGTFGVSSDVTELIETQQTLEKERNTLRTLLDSIPDSIYIRDRGGKYIVVNRALADLVGADDPQGVTGKTPYDFFPDDKAQILIVEDAKVMDVGETVINQSSIVSAQDGDTRHLLTTKVPMRDRDGNVFGILGINRDITEQEKARKAVRQTEHRIQEIVDNSPSPMYAKSVTGRYLMVNRRYEELFGLKSEDVVGKTDMEIIGDEAVVKELQKNDKLVLERREPIQFEETLTFKDGQHAYVSMKFPMRDLDGEIYAMGGISTDITERKKAERALQELNQELMQTHENLTSAHEQLIQAEKMESVGRLAAGVAHEVKNPLAMIGMGLELLTRRLPEGDTKSKETIERMKRGIDRAKKIVRGLVDYSSDRRLEFHSHDPNRLVLEALELVEYQLIEGGITIEFTPDKELPWVDADQTKIEQVLVNLFINAMHSMEDGGTLAIRSERVSRSNVVHDEGSRLRDRAHEGDEMVRIIVTDTGKGIPEEVLSKLFDPFFTTKATGKGTGLGLTVSRKIAELHGGELVLANREGGGGAMATLTLRVMKT